MGASPVPGQPPRPYGADMPKIKDYDWTIEVVVENLDIKKKVYEEVEKYRKPGTLITSNTFISISAAT